MRHLMLAALAAIALPAMAQDATDDGIFVEDNTYRSGGAFVHIAAESPQACARSCARDRRCGSWSFIKYDPLFNAARCELKQGIGAPERDPNAASGLSPAMEANFYTPRSIADDAELLGAPSQK